MRSGSAPRGGGPGGLRLRGLQDVMKVAAQTSRNEKPIRQSDVRACKPAKTSFVMRDLGLVPDQTPDSVRLEDEALARGDAGHAWMAEDRLGLRRVLSS